MFSPDVVNLRQFYATPFGEAACSLIAAALRTLWPDARGDAVLGIGYCPPYLETYLDEGAPVMACMPAQQGAAYWPASRLNRVFLAAESDLPLSDNSITVRSGWKFLPRRVASSTAGRPSLPPRSATLSPSPRPA